MTDQIAREKFIRNRLLLLVVGEATLLMPLALASGHGLVSPRFFGWFGIALSLGFGGAFVWILRLARAKFPAPAAAAAPMDESTRRRFRRIILLLKIGVAFFAVNLIYGLYVSWGEAWPSIVMGVAINLLIQAAFLQGIRTLQRKLRQGSA